MTVHDKSDLGHVQNPPAEETCSRNWRRAEVLDRLSQLFTVFSWHEGCGYVGQELWGQLQLEDIVGVEATKKYHMDEMKVPLKNASVMKLLQRDTSQAEMGGSRMIENQVG